MKKLFAILTVSLLFAVTARAQTFISVAASKVNNTTVDSVITYLNPANIYSVKKMSATQCLVLYKNPQTANGVITYECKTLFDSAYNRANKHHIYLVKLQQADLVTSSYTQYAYAVSSITDMTAKTFSQYPLAATQVTVKQNLTRYIPVVEPGSAIRSRLDSLDYVDRIATIMQNRKQDTSWITHGLHDTLWRKIGLPSGSVTSFDTIKR